MAMQQDEEIRGKHAKHAKAAADNAIEEAGDDLAEDAVQGADEEAVVRGSHAAGANAASSEQSAPANASDDDAEEADDLLASKPVEADGLDEDDVIVAQDADDDDDWLEAALQPKADFEDDDTEEPIKAVDVFDAAPAPTQAAAQQAEAAARVTPDVEPLQTMVMPAATSAGTAATQPAQAAPQAAASPFVSPGTPGWTPIDYEAAHKKRSNAKKAAGIAVGLVAALAIGGYAIGANYFTHHFYPGSTLNGQDISLQTEDDVAAKINQIASEYQVQVSGAGLDFTVSSQDMGIQVDGAKIASEAIAENDPWKWPAQMGKAHDITERLVTEYNAAGLEQAVAAKVDEWNETAENPVNATLAYNADANAYDVVEEQYGTKFDTQKVLEVVDAAVMDMQPTAQLSEDQMAKPAILSDNEDLLNAQATANNYVKADLHLILGQSSEVGEVNADQISQWVRIGDDLNVSFDEEAMDGWLTEFGNGLDTVGSQRTYTRPDGKTVTVDGGTYGWEVDTAAMVELVREEIKNGTQGEVSIPWIAGAAFYYGPGEVDWSDYIDVDLSEQHARYISGTGEVRWESDTITGRPDGKHDTPTGIWTLFSMESPATLKGEIQETTGAPEYETKVQYWMPFTYSGCGLHDATWQPSFGGNMYAEGYGSHGCVNLSYDAAQSLYSIAVVGIPVIVHW